MFEFVELLCSHTNLTSPTTLFKKMLSYKVFIRPLIWLFPFDWTTFYFSKGFSSNPSTWLPVNPDYWRVNVESQKEVPNSRYNMFKALSKLRKTKTLKFGNFESYVISSSIYAFSRSVWIEKDLLDWPLINLNEIKILYFYPGV